MAEERMLRRARREDIPAMHRVRTSVRENRLTVSVVTEADYLPAIERDGRGFVLEAAGWKRAAVTAQGEVRLELYRPPPAPTSEGGTP